MSGIVFYLELWSHEDDSTAVKNSWLLQHNFMLEDSDLTLDSLEVIYAGFLDRFVIVRSQNILWNWPSMGKSCRESCVWVQVKSSEKVQLCVICIEVKLVYDLIKPNHRSREWWRAKCGALGNSKGLFLRYKCYHNWSSLESYLLGHCLVGRAGRPLTRVTPPLSHPLYHILSCSVNKADRRPKLYI